MSSKGASEGSARAMSSKGASEGSAQAKVFERRFGGIRSNKKRRRVALRSSAKAEQSRAVMCVENSIPAEKFIESESDLCWGDNRFCPQA